MALGSNAAGGVFVRISKKSGFFGTEDPNMKTAAKIAVGAALALQVAATPVRANDDAANAIAGAVAILVFAALARNSTHSHDGYRPANDKPLARSERGYRDGLHNEPYDSRHGSTAYAHGFDAGQKKRRNRLAHKTRNVDGTKVPVNALRSCRDEAASSSGVGKHDVHLTKAGQEGSDNFYIELASGHRHVICGTNSQGQVFNLRNGRL